MIRPLVLVGIVAALVSVSYAQTIESTAEERKDVSVTVYNENLGLIREVRELKLPAGVLSLRFQDVASRIDPTSVNVEVLRGLRDFMVLEQNYEFDLISPNKLMEKYIGRVIELVVKHPQTGKESSLSAKLLSMNGGPIYRIDEKIHVGHPGRVVLPGIPENLIARPTLIWLLDSRGGAGEIEVSYLTSGMGWKADYVALLGDKDVMMDVTAWVTLTNMSGTGYRDAKLKLIAGTVHRVERKVAIPRREVETVSAMALKPGVVEEPFFEYHLYTLPRRTTLKDNQTKQVELLKAHHVGLVKEYILPPKRALYRPGRRLEGVEKEHVVVMIRFENTEKNNLGKPLPAGIFRFYKKDSGGNLQLVGEDMIEHVPRDEKVSLRLGEAFDIVAERIQTDYKEISKGKVYEYEYKITLHNAKDEDVTVRVEEDIGGDWEILQYTHEPFKESAHRVIFQVPIAKRSESILSYRVRVR